MKKGLVLEGGGVKGSYQIGAYYAFKESHIKIDGFVGTSIGSFNAAMLASGKERELLEYWYNIDPGKILGFDDRFSDSFNSKFDVNALIGAFATFKDILLNLGIRDDYLREEINRLVNFNDLIKSSKDFGLVTCNLSKMKPVYVYKQDIQGQKDLVEYITASCYLPGFKQKKVIDNSYYVDGGFYDNAPIKLLDDLNYDMVYVIDIHGIGFIRKGKYKAKVKLIEPSRKNGSILEMNKKIIRDNILMGYYDALRVIKNYDGYKYCFKRKSDWYYKFITRKVDKKLIRRLSNFFGVDSLREIVIKSLEYVMDKDNYYYYYVYNVSKCIKDYRNNDEKQFVYKFVSKLKFLW